MKAERLLELYDRISEAPDAVSRLRRFVLDLAVRGKLVEQDPEDAPASTLLARISVEKEQLLANRKRRKASTSEPADKSEPSFALPRGWIFSRIEDLGVISPRNDAPDDAIASFVPMPKIASEYGYPHQHEPRTWGEIKKGYTHFAEGDVGLAKITPCFENGKSTVFRNLSGGIGAGTTELHVLRPILVNSDYVLLFLKSPQFIESGISNMTGTAGQKRVPREYFANTPFPLPPLAEQHRIVAKVDELMALCDRLEEQHGTRETTRDRLTTATLSRLTAPDTDEQSFRFRDHARFALDTLPALTARPDQIKALRQTILNLAVRGKLVGQDASDEPVALQDEVIRDGQEKPLFEIPRTWRWVRLDTLGVLKGGGTPDKSREDYWHGSVPWVSPKDMKVPYLERSALQITEQAVTNTVVTLIEPSSVLFVVRGMILAHSFPVALARVPLTINQDMKALKLHQPCMAEYVLRALRGMTPEMLKRVQRSSHGTCRIEASDYKGFLLPVPPIVEQHRIVAVVDELMALCDRLETSLQEAGNKRARLLESLLAEALAPAEETQEAA